MGTEGPLVSVLQLPIMGANRLLFEPTPDSLRSQIIPSLKRTNLSRPWQGGSLRRPRQPPGERQNETMGAGDVRAGTVHGQRVDPPPVGIVAPPQ